MYVTGCLSQRYREDLEQSIPEVDAWFGTMELPLILKGFEADYKAELIGERLLATPQHYAYLKIAEGCNRTCAFCAIPLMRGQHQSRSMEDLVKEAESLARRGVKEIMLIAQELTYYGLDLYKKRMLSDLLKRLSDVEGIEWIRLHYAYPHKFPLEILHVMRERNNICKYLDMPLQHAADNMLKAMRRQITRVEMEELIQNIREMVPGICLRTTLIAGFPRETLEDVEELKAFLERQRFDRVGTFTYSHEENTSAYHLIDDVPAEEKQRRAEDIMSVQQEISYEKNQEKIGQTFKVLIESSSKRNDKDWMGRNSQNKVIVFPKGNKEHKPGDYVWVKVTDCTQATLLGELV